jgi:hypothetical protein
MTDKTLSDLSKNPLNLRCTWRLTEDLFLAYLITSAWGGRGWAVAREKAAADVALLHTQCQTGLVVFQLESGQDIIHFALRFPNLLGSPRFTLHPISNESGRDLQ